ncbi:endonuclease/exonuclease/phosphatase family protein [Streptomyces sp. NPDC053493]|uniref:endonuclease/exonuclease/phosphatase family protein n=1 Tax=Streptomyces sp. NPDC053493 TaxID=3365705 RepID=UPI0037D6F6AF
MRRRGTCAVVPALLAAALGGMPRPAAADVPTPATAPMVRFLTYNICGNSKVSGCADPRTVKPRREEVVRQAKEWKADLVFLQEVCRQQYNAVDESLTAEGYSPGHFAPTHKASETRDDCLMDDPTDGTAGAVRGDYGIAVFAKGPISSRVTLDPSVGPYGNVAQATAPEDWYAACVEATVQSVRTRACSVHLWPNNPPPYPQDLTLTQARNLAADPWLHAGTAVVLGGDFNPVNREGGERPRSADLDPFYLGEPFHLGKAGSVRAGGLRWRETDETDTAHFDAPCEDAAGKPLVERCRSGQHTHAANGKLDYVFVDESHFTNVAAAVDAPAPSREGISDHLPYRGAATFTHCATEADRYADLLRVDADGDLWRHDGRGDGTIAAEACKIGFGWKDARLVARAGDVDQDGDDDLYALDTRGVLRFHEGDRSSGLFTRAPREVARGLGSVDQLAVSPDMDGDGSPDLVLRTADGTLMRASTRPDGGVGPSVVLSSAFGAYDTVLAPGDLTGDGRPDLLARTPAGELYRFAGRTGGALRTGVRVGSGWNVFSRLLAPGNLDGDPAGRGDLLGVKPHSATDRRKDLFLHRGTGNPANPFPNPAPPLADVNRSGWNFPPDDRLF